MDHPKDVLPDLHNVGEEWQNPPTARKAMGGWLEERLLLLALLPWDQDTERRQRLAQIAVDLCVSHEELHFYLPPLLLDHIIGCQPDGEERFLTWQLYADPPIGVERYPLGNVSLSLYAKQEKGEGTHLLIETSAPVAVEIVTAERTYLELLAAGQHDLTLTVLDRTDVR
jgi:hypothetical protein